MKNDNTQKRNGIWKFASGSRGFTLLLAALFASIALSLGTSIYSIVSKEVTLSSIGQDSQYAFYAADTAAECALFWDTRSDIHPNTFATSSYSTDEATSVSCDGKTSTLTVASSNGSAATSTFEIANLFDDVSAGYCADVTVGKSIGVNGAVHTVIEANGYSVPCASISTATDALQRSVNLTY
jgi:hypothetical protein